MQRHVLGVRSLGRLLSQQRTDQALGTRAETLGHGKVAARDLGEEGRVLGVIERITTDQHRVEQHAQRPDVRCLAGIGTSGAQHFRRDIRRASSPIGQLVVVVLDDHRVLEALQAKPRSVRTKKEIRMRQYVWVHFSKQVSYVTFETSAFYVSFFFSLLSLILLYLTPWIHKSDSKVVEGV